MHPSVGLNHRRSSVVILVLVSSLCLLCIDRVSNTRRSALEGEFHAEPAASTVLNVRFLVKNDHVIIMLRLHKLSGSRISSWIRGAGMHLDENFTECNWSLEPTLLRIPFTSFAVNFEDVDCPACMVKLVNDICQALQRSVGAHS